MGYFVKSIIILMSLFLFPACGKRIEIATFNKSKTIVSLKADRAWEVGQKVYLDLTSDGVLKLDDRCVGSVYGGVASTPEFSFYPNRIEIRLRGLSEGKLFISRSTYEINSEKGMLFPIKTDN